jgi:hypothetical protein
MQAQDYRDSVLKCKAILFLFAIFSSAFYPPALIAAQAAWTVQASVYNVHYRPSREHLRYSPLVAVEYVHGEDRLAGVALFRNSFGQFSQLAYLGRRYDIGDTPFYGKWVAGVLHGYRGRYQHKVPYNHRGFSPALLPGVGYRYRAWQVETQFFWTNGLMVTAGFAWP